MGELDQNWPLRPSAQGTSKEKHSLSLTLSSKISNSFLKNSVITGEYIITHMEALEVLAKTTV